jgi:hypothetical protein
MSTEKSKKLQNTVRRTLVWSEIERAKAHLEDCKTNRANYILNLSEKDFNTNKGLYDFCVAYHVEKVRLAEQNLEKLTTFRAMLKEYKAI